MSYVNEGVLWNVRGLRLSRPRVKQRVEKFWCVLCMTLGNSPSVNEAMEVGNFLNNEEEALHWVMERSDGRVELMELL